MFDNAKEIFTPSWDRINAEQNTLTGNYGPGQSKHNPEDSGCNINMNFEEMLEYMLGRRIKKSRAQ